MRQSRAATTTPLFASASLNIASDVRSWPHQAPPCRSIISGNGPAPFGLNRRSSSGLPPWLRYSTSSTVNSYAVRDGVGLMAALVAGMSVSSARASREPAAKRARGAGTSSLARGRARGKGKAPGGKPRALILTDLEATRRRLKIRRAYEWVQDTPHHKMATRPDIGIKHLGARSSSVSLALSNSARLSLSLMALAFVLSAAGCPTVANNWWIICLET